MVGEQKQCALLPKVRLLVGEEGFEPSRPQVGQGILSPQRLPFRHSPRGLIAPKCVEAATGFEPVDDGFANRCLSRLATPPLL